MKIPSKDFRVYSGKKLKLKKWPTRTDQFYQSPADYKSKQEAYIEKLDTLQNVFYASGKYSVLIIFQAMDAAGKDSTIQHVLSGINPQGCEVTSFKQPSATELKHDFLWRTSLRLPEKGKIGVFNRSYYEEVLVVRVHPEYLGSEGIALGKNKKLWEERYRSINDFEKHLSRNGTKIIKFFLHVSKEEQARRFLARIDEPAKNWKFNSADMSERKLWKEYQDAYENCIAATSTEVAPWHIIPADDKMNARLIVSQIINDTIGEMKLAYPKVTAEDKKQMQVIKKTLLAELKS